MRKSRLLFFIAVVTLGLVTCNQNPVIETTDIPTPIPTEDPGIQTRNTYTGTRIGGITGARYAAFYDTTAINAGYVGTFDMARASWNNISSKVVIDRSTTYVEANDIYSVSSLDRGAIAGETRFFIRNTSGVFIQSDQNIDHHHCQVVVYNGSINSLWIDPTSRAVWTPIIATHEVGHSLKLDHNTQAPGYSVMRPDGNANGVQTYDRNELIRKWGQ